MGSRVKAPPGPRLGFNGRVGIGAERVAVPDSPVRRVRDAEEKLIPITGGHNGTRPPVLTRLGDFSVRPLAGDA
jgi:hypothetical protein